jgi:hypothetical protein
MPKFMLILRGDATADYSKFTPDDFAKILGEYEAWGGKLAAEGRLTLGQKLTDEGGRVIWPRGGKKVEVKDGPLRRDQGSRRRRLHPESRQL